MDHYLPKTTYDALVEALVATLAADEPDLTDRIKISLGIVADVWPDTIRENVE